MANSQTKTAQAKRTDWDQTAGEALDLETHRRILDFINRAVGEDDLVPAESRQDLARAAENGRAGDGEADGAALLDEEVARTLIRFRNLEAPLGLRSLREVTDAGILPASALKRLLEFFGRSRFGEWSAFPQRIPRRGPGSYDGIIHAAMLRTGQVLFITADETTLLWDPEDSSPATFQDPLNQPHLMTGGYSQLCGHHVFLTDGRLLSVGGGGYGHNPLAKWGYTFDPGSRSWARTAGPMSESRWYPTAVALADPPGRVLIVCGHGHGEMDVYDEATDTFTPVASGDTKPFPYLYPGIHLLPSNVLFYSRTGWGTAGPGGGPFGGADEDQSAYFTLTGTHDGVWTNIAPISPAEPDRTKGMSVLLLSRQSPQVRVMSLGGADPTTNHTYEIVDLTSVSPATDWAPPVAFPDGQHRSLGSAVLLPDGSVFVSGGVQQPNSPCAIFDPENGSWRAAAALPSVRDYHSAAMLLPSGKVMMAGWNNTAIEVFSPPYLFRGARPVITTAPNALHYGQHFIAETPPPTGKSVDRVVLVRPMAVTHQTDTEQRVIELDWAHKHEPAHPKKLRLRAPQGGSGRALAPPGYYMMFLISNEGVPSIAKWIHLS